jgi:UDP-N-acetylmuramyl pentapeptide phosphotransferase/UDP-N-acetylglucosamine-1-phosphate transferase
MTIIWSVLAAAMVSYLTIFLMLWSGRAGPLDIPNHRSLHAIPVPRSGGVGIVVGVAVAAISVSPPAAIVFAATGLAAISWWDDNHSLGVKVRFAAQFFAATVVVMMGPVPEWGWVGMFGMILAIVWMTNLYNFMDGANGLAGGMAVVGFGAYAFAAQSVGGIDLALFCAALSAAAAGFLVFNFDPARVFMGDVGSIPLGFLAATLGLHGIANGSWPAWFPLLVFSPFIADATVTLVKRAVRGAKVWEAHREHCYQRLVACGWSHRLLAIRAYSLMLLLAAVACAVLRQPVPVQLTVLAVIAFGYAFLLWFIERYIDNRTNLKSPNEPN